MNLWVSELLEIPRQNLNLSPLGQRNWVKRFCPGCSVWRSGGLRVQVVYRPLSPFSSQGLFCCLQWGNEKLRSGLGGACFWEVDVFLRCIFFQSPWGLPVSFVFLLFPRIRERKTSERAEWSVDQNRLLNCTVEGPQKFSREAEFIYLRDGRAIWKRWGLWFGELPDF